MSLVRQMIDMQARKDASSSSRHAAIDADGGGAVISPCWSCKGPVDGEAFFCPICETVQPPGQIDHFSRLGIECSFDVDGDALDQCYFGLQRRLHPDRFATRTSSERLLSQQQATSLNEAYETLKDPLRRAAYLVDMKGGAVLKSQGDSLANDPGLLMESMERREALADAETAAQVAAIAVKTASDIEACIAGISAAFSTEDLSAACRLTTRLKFLHKLGEESRTRKADLGRG